MRGCRIEVVWNSEAFRQAREFASSLILAQGLCKKCATDDAAFDFLTCCLDVVRDNQFFFIPECFKAFIEQAKSAPGAAPAPKAKPKAAPKVKAGAKPAAKPAAKYKAKAKAKA